MPSNTETMDAEIKKPEHLEQANTLAIIQGNIVKTVHAAMPSFEQKDIVDTLSKILSAKKNQSLSESELAEKVILSLIQKKKPVTTPGKKKKIEDMRHNLLQFET